MALRRDDTSSGCSWIPTTPAKLGSTEQQLICTNSEENQSVQAKWLESERLNPVNQAALVNLTESRSVGDFLEESSFHNIPACCSSNSANVSEGGQVNSQVYGEALCNFDIWQSGSSCVHGEELRVYDNMNDAEKWVNMSFTDLLALADAGTNTMSFGNSLAPKLDSLPGGRFDGGNSLPETPFGGISIHSRLSFDHNTLPRTFQHAALSTSTRSHFEPITPEKNWQVQHRQDSTAMQELSTDDWPTKEAQNNTVTKEEVEGHNENKKLSQLLNSQLCTTTPGQLKENHKPDKKGTDEVDITKTPQQKSRRKKHRPKVIKEGKTKSAPKLCPEKPLGPQETIRVKRKYTRRASVNNSISSPSQGEANETDANTKAAIAKDTPVGKRQRTNRKAVCKPEGTVDMGAIKIVDQMTGGSTRSSCRRSLNFDSECQVRDECSMYIQSSNCNMETRAENFSRDDQSRTNVKHRQSKEVMMEKNEMGIAHGITGFIYQELDDYMSVHKKCSPSSAPPAETDQPQKDNYLSDRSLSVKGKCQIVFSDVTNDKEVNTVQLTANISNDSINSSLLTPDRLAGRFKRHVDTTAKEEQYSNDSTETLNYSIPRDQFIFLQRTSKNCGFPEMHFPVVSKRNRSEMGFNTTTNSQYSNVKVGKCTHIAQLLPSATNQGSSYLQCQATEMPMGNSSATQDGRQVFDLLALGTGEKVRKRKSKAPTQVQNSTSILEMPVSQGADTKKLKNGKTIGQHAHVKALIADASSPVPKVHLKRILPNSIVRNGYNHRELPAISNGSPLAITWKHLSQIDSIVDQLNQLNLNAETSQISTQNQHAFVADHMHFQMQGAIVPYQRGGAVVAFNGSFDQVRKRQPRPKVDLDDETARVWKLLLENINSEGIDGTDEHNAKWWEEERRVFSGRADSFIARMHLVQGDRRFSPWKGSVVDSVVGVFLTQNVSDHLSSSAFMSLAARFPLKAKAIPAELHEARVDTIINEPVICMLEPEETVGSNKNIVLEPVRLDDVKLLNDIENGDIGVVNSVNSLGNSSDDIVAKEGLSDISQCSSVISHASASNKSPSLNRDGQDMDEAVSSQTAVIYSQNSADSPIAKTTERTESSQHEHSIEEPAAGIQPNKFTSSTSFVRLLQMAGTELHGVYCNCSYKEEFDGSQKVQSENSHVSSQTEYSLTGSTFATEANVCSMSASRLTPNSGAGAEQAELSKRCSQSYDSSKGKGLPTAEISGLSVECVSQSTMKFTSVTSKECPNFSRPDDNIGINPEMAGKQMSQLPSLGHFEGKCCKINIPQMDVTGSNSNIDISRKSEQNEVNSKNDPVYHPGEDGPKTKGGNGKDKHGPVDWDALRKQALNSGSKGGRTANTMDSVDWEAVRRADVSEVADAVKERGMNNKLAERIKDFLDRIVRDHESADLEWLREVPPDKAKEYLLSIRGLGLKSVECVRLLTLHQLAFPVDTNVGRIAVRLGWVPLQPLPESLQLHLLELYPVLESIQKYLWPRLCKLDQKTLYELHYQLITFGKVFCTKSRPNCNACPMRGECRHFASAFASARLALPAPEDKSIVSAAENKSAGQTPTRAVNTLELPAPQANHMDVTPRVSNSLPIVEEPKTPEPIIELPATPETEDTQILECDIEDTFYEDPEEIPSIQLNMEEFTQNLQKVMQQNTELQEGSMSNALVALTREAASIPVPKLKNVSRLRTEHQVYELPDSHPLLQGMEQREPDDPSPYLLAIWTPGETVNSIEPPERRCSSQESEKLCTDETCSSCNSKREINSLTVRGTLLIPCRTAMRGSFPLNGTYFQVNEVFSDHESSLAPIDVPREWLWNLPRRIVYFGTSVPTIFKGLTTEQIQYCFWRGFVCVRGFDRKARAPRPLIARLHFPASKMAKGKGKTGEN